MSKRSHTDFSQGASPLVPTKRAKQTSEEFDAVSLLLEHSQELSKLLKSLETDGVSDRLVTLSKTLLPAFETLSKSSRSSNAAVLRPDSAVARAVAQIEQGQGSGKDSANSKQADTVSRTGETKAVSPPSVDGPSRFSNRIPPMGKPLAAWQLSDISDSYPLLPPILDPHLEAMAARHHGSRKNDWEASYENLEFLGDAFIYHVASEIIAQTFPHLQPGRCSQLRERILRNSNLAQYSRHYGIEKRASLPAEFIGNGREGGTKAKAKDREKVQGDLFEAYVGAMVHSGPQGVEDAVTWLRPLWAMTLAEDIRAEYKRAAAAAAVTTVGEIGATDAGGRKLLVAPSADVAPVVLPPKVQLTKLISCKNVEIRYVDEQPSKALKDRNSGDPLFVVAVQVHAWGDTRILGRGTALSKKEAGSKAAEQALLNKKMMKFYTAKKGEFLREEERRKKMLGV